MARSAPRLSICIPTFNRADLLEVCLATVLPQLASAGSEVECVICDNASSDRTAELIADFSARFSLRSFRNDTNIGIIANITRCVSELAEGEYVFLIGDDDVLVAGAIERILSELRAVDSPDLVVLNVGYLPRTERPNAQVACGGVHVCCSKTLRKSAAEGRMSFEDVLEGPTADLTASYSVVLRRNLWRQHFPEACHDEPFTSVRTTYPSAWVIARSMPGKPVIVIASPMVIIYEMPGDEFSWARFRALNSLVYATQLLQLYERQGVSRQRLEPYFLYQLNNRGAELGDLLWNRQSAGGWRAAIQFVWLMKGYPFRLLRMLLVSFGHPQAPRLFQFLPRSLLWLKRNWPGR